MCTTIFSEAIADADGDADANTGADTDTDADAGAAAACECGREDVHAKRTLAASASERLIG
jgi:hypothetical protein